MATDEGRAPDMGEVEGESDPFQDALDALAGEEGAYVGVYRRDKSQSPEWCGNLAIEEFALERVRREWGGGRFDFRLVRAGKYVKGKTVRIAGPHVDLSTLADPETPRGREERRGAEVSHRRAEVADMSTMEAIGALRNDLREFLQSVRNPPREAEHANPAAMAVELAKNMQAIMQPYLDLMRDGAGGRRSSSDMDPMEWIQLGMELKGNAGGGDPYANVLRELGNPLMKLLAAGGAGGVPEPSGPGVQEAPHVEQEPGNALEALRPWIPHLINWAVSGRDPQLRADFIADELPSRFSDMLDRFVGTSDALTVFFTRFPDAMPHRVWFEQLFRGLRVAYGHDEDEPQPGGIEVVPD